MEPRRHTPLEPPLELPTPHVFPTDFVDRDSWIRDRGPHYCELCGYDVVNRTSAGALRPVMFDYVYFEHLPGRKWHPDCARRDSRIEQARLALQDALRGVF